MRVIAGTARSMPLKTIEGLETRPTTDRIKETLFNMLQADIHGSLFLDLFSGSGAIGIEALSRGAKKAVFVDHSKPCITCIKENLQFTNLDDRGVVIHQDVLSAISKLSGSEVFDIVFMDAPYDNGLEKDALRQLSQSGIIDQDSIIIIEESKDADMSFVEEVDFYVYKTKIYKTNKHVFVRLNEH